MSNLDKVAEVLEWMQSGLKKETILGAVFPGERKPTSRAEAHRAEYITKHARCLELRRKGLTYAKIGKLVGLSHNAARLAVQKAEAREWRDTRWDKVVSEVKASGEPPKFVERIDDLTTGEDHEEE